MKHGKKYQDSTKLVDTAALYDTTEALENCLKTAKAKFDETVEIHVRLGVDSRHAEQQVRGAVVLPNGTGKTVRVLVFCKGDKVDAALAAGADYAGAEEYMQKIQGGWMDFDVAIATTSAMKEVRKLARILGPRGLMPNPKSGTVTDDVEAAIKEVKGGRVEYKMDKTANLVVVVGKRSFANDKLLENAKTALASVAAARPEAIKGKFINSISISSTMSPAVKVALSEVAE